MRGRDPEGVETGRTGGMSRRFVVEPGGSTVTRLVVSLGSVSCWNLVHSPYLLRQRDRHRSWTKED